MTLTKIVRDNEFSEVAEVKSDGKYRVTLKKVKSAGKMYRVYENNAGQVLLDPIVTIPACEAWLFGNKDALASVRKGLRESNQGELIKKNRKARS